MPRRSNLATPVDPDASRAAHPQVAPHAKPISRDFWNFQRSARLPKAHVAPQSKTTLAKKHDLVKKDAALSLACPEEKLRIPADRLEDAEEGPGAKMIKVDGVDFRISLVAPKDKTEKEKPLLAKEFVLYRAGIYDMTAIKEMPWGEYRPFVLKLFGVKERPEKRYGLTLDGYIGTDAAHCTTCAMSLSRRRLR
jgi:hypothetical protein